MKFSIRASAILLIVVLLLGMIPMGAMVAADESTMDEYEAMLPEDRYECEDAVAYTSADRTTPAQITRLEDPYASGGATASNTKGKYLVFENVPEGNSVHIPYASTHTDSMEFYIRYPGETEFTSEGKIYFSTSNSTDMWFHYIATSHRLYIPEGSDIMVSPNDDCNLDCLWVAQYMPFESSNAAANIVTSTMMSSDIVTDLMASYDLKALPLDQGESVTFTVPQGKEQYNVLSFYYRAETAISVEITKNGTALCSGDFDATAPYTYAGCGMRMVSVAPGDQVTFTCTDGSLHLDYIKLDHAPESEIVTVSALPTDGQRLTVSLDGVWDFGTKAATEWPLPDAVPEDVSFINSIPVPGLWDNAAFEAGSYENAQAWYKKTVVLEEEPTEQVLLYIESALYGRHIYVNGQYVDTYEYNYSRSYTDLTGLLHAGENEIVVMLGSKEQQRKDTDTRVHALEDGESPQSEPGFTGSVSLIFNQSPEVSAVQTNPDIDAGTLELLISLTNRKDEALTTDVTVSVYELGVFENGVANQAEVKVCETTFPDVAVAANDTYKYSCAVALDDWSRDKCWSPDSPFLYRVEIRTSGDTYTFRTGMRVFDFDPETFMARLNGETFFLTGTNVAIERYFDDPLVGTTPWEEDWIRKLYTEYKETNWDSFRTHLGHAPDLWFDLADEMGMLIFDELPFWGGPTNGCTIDNLMPEVYAWIDARGYRPSLVVFDSNNESNMAVFAEMIARGREYDIQKRPWDNGWGTPVGENDPIECHPYIMGGTGMYGLGSMIIDRPVVVPVDIGWDIADYMDHPRIINEHGEYWISRDGVPMSGVYSKWDTILPNATNEERLTYYADLMAAEIELFREGRAYTGIQFFCGLGSSPAGAQGITSDILAPDVSTAESLQIRPYTKERLKDAFADLGISVHYFEPRAARGAATVFPVTLINDTGKAIADLPVTLTFTSGDRILYKEVVTMSVDTFTGGKTGVATEEFTLNIPAYHDYCENRSQITFTASYELDGEVVLSKRDILIQGGAFVNGEPPVYDDETDTDESDTAVVSDTEPVADQTTSPDEGESDLGVDPAGCKAVLPVASVLLPTSVGLWLICRKRKDRKDA